MAASSSDWLESSSAAEEASSELAAFCWVTLSISPTAPFTISMPAACSFAEAAISATMSDTFWALPTISASLLEARWAIA